MTKNEALKAAIDGKKVGHSTWRKDCFVKWNGSSFEDETLNQLRLYVFSDTGWQIVPELVSFDEAWKAYEQGKKIISGVTGRHFTLEAESSFCHPSEIRRDEIRGQWQILDD